MRMCRLFPLLLALLLLTGCWQEPVSEQEENPPWMEETGDVPEAGSSLPAAFALPYHRDLTLDPVTCGADVQQNIASLLFEPLFSLDDTFTPQPLLCAACSHNEDCTQWLLTIRGDVTFSDGSTLTAADAASSLRRAMTSQRYSYRLRQVKSVTVNKDQQVVVTLEEPNSAFPALLDIPVVKMGTEDSLIPVGTGPYVFVTGEGGAWLASNDSWWQGDSQPVDRIALVHAKDQETAMALFTSRQVQLCSFDLTGLSPLSFTGDVVCTDVPDTSFHFVGFNCSNPLLADPLVRRALAAGVPRDQLVQGLLSGHARATQFPVSPVSPVYPQDLEETYRYEEFAAAMAAAGLDSGEETHTLTMIVNQENSFKVSAARYLAETLSDFDLTVELEILSWEDYSQALERGDFDLYYGEVKMTADWNMENLVGTGGSLNYGGFSDPELDALLSTLSAAQDREAVCRTLCARLKEQMPILSICFKDYSVLTHEGVVEGLAPTAANVFQNLDQWTIHLDSTGAKEE